MEEIVGQAKWTNTNHTKGQSSTKKGDIVGLDGRTLMGSFWKNNLFQQVLFLIKATENITQWKELVNTKLIIFHHDTIRPHFFDDQAKGKFDSSAIFHQTLHLQIFIHFSLTKCSLVKSFKFTGRLYKAYGRVLCSNR